MNREILSSSSQNGLKMVLIVVGACLCLVAPSHAQTCMNPANLCDQWWDSSTSRWIQNPSCAFVNHFFLLSTTPAANPSDGYVDNPAGKQCGAERNGQGCGVRTTTNTCAESTGPIFCDPTYDPGCCGDPYDPSCGLGGDPWPPCGIYEDCYYSAPGRGGVEGAAPASGSNTGLGGALSAPRGSAALEGALRRAVLVSPLPPTQSTLLQALSRADAIHLKAQVTFSFDGKKTTSSYEYWERGARYRIRIDPPSDHPWSDIAFNGTLLQAQAGSDAVEIRRGDDRFTPLPDGPLALALAPLRVNDYSACLLCQLRLADLKKAMQWRHEAPAAVKAAEAALGTGVFDAGALRTGESDAEGRLVHFVWPPDEAGPDSGFEVTLSDYQPIGGTGAMFPMRLIARLKLNSFVEYAVEKIDLSPSFGDEVFDIYSKSPKLYYGFRDATGSWTGRFVRYTRTPGPTSCNTKTMQEPKP
jgi:hypothetical protein